MDEEPVKSRTTTRAQIDLPKEEITKFCEKRQIRKFAFFGSVLRDDFRPDNDIDVLVTFEEDARHTLFDLVHMQTNLSKSSDVMWT